MKKIVTILLIATLLASLCFACLASCDTSDGNKIRVSEVTHSLFYTPQYLALALGYFEEEGLTVEITNGSGADNVMTALLTNEADIGLMGCEANIYVYLQGKKDYPKVIGQLTKRDGSFLVARTNMPNFDYSGIDNQTVLMGRKGGMPAMILQYVLNNKGYTDGQNITMDYSIQFGALGPAFTGGTGDLVPLFEPAASQLEVEGKGYIVSSIGQDSGEIPYTCFMAKQSYIDKNGDKIRGLLKAVTKAIKYLDEHDSASVAKLLTKYFDGTSEASLKTSVDSYKKIDAWVKNMAMEETAYERLLDVIEQAGELKARVPFHKTVLTEAADRAYREIYG